MRKSRNSRVTQQSAPMKTLAELDAEAEKRFEEARERAARIRRSLAVSGELNQHHGS